MTRVYYRTPKKRGGFSWNRLAPFSLLASVLIFGAMAAIYFFPRNEVCEEKGLATIEVQGVTIGSKSVERINLSHCMSENSNPNLLSFAVEDVLYFRTDFDSTNQLKSALNKRSGQLEKEFGPYYGESPRIIPVSAY